MDNSREPAEYGFNPRAGRVRFRIVAGNSNKYRRGVHSHPGDSSRGVVFHPRGVVPKVRHVSKNLGSPRVQLEG
jgi:hypothetical protein